MKYSKSVNDSDAAKYLLMNLYTANPELLQTEINDELHKKISHAKVEFFAKLNREDEIIE